MLLLLRLLHIWKEAVWHQRLVGQRHWLLLLLLLSTEQQTICLTKVLLLLYWPGDIPRSCLLCLRLLVRRQIELRLRSLLPDETLRRFVRCRIGRGGRHDDGATGRVTSLHLNSIWVENVLC